VAGLVMRSAKCWLRPAPGCRPGPWPPCSLPPAWPGCCLRDQPPRPHGRPGSTAAATPLSSSLRSAPGAACPVFKRRSRRHDAGCATTPRVKLAGCWAAPARSSPEGRVRSRARCSFSPGSRLVSRHAGDQAGVKVAPEAFRGKPAIRKVLLSAPGWTNDLEGSPPPRFTLDQARERLWGMWSGGHLNRHGWLPCALR
jgi:hypothetical protein